MATFEEKAERLKKELEEATNDDQRRNLSREYELTLRLLRIIRGEVFTLDDINKCRMEIMRLYPGYDRPITAESGILLAAEAIRKSFGKKYYLPLYKYPILIDFGNTGWADMRDPSEQLYQLYVQKRRGRVILIFPLYRLHQRCAFHIMLFQQFIKRGLWIKNLSTKSSIRDLAVVPVILQGAFRDAEDAANLLTGQVQFISDGRAVRVDQNIDSPDGFDDVAVQFLERGAVAGDDLFGHATGFFIRFFSRRCRMSSSRNSTLFPNAV